MADYAFDAGTLKAFGARACPDDPAGRLAYWADLADAAGPALLPFIAGKDRWNDIPFAELGLKKLDPAALVPQPKEMWVLFCFRHDGPPRPAPADAPLRRDGFPLVLEWRKGTADSPLLSPAFHELARTVREQLAAPDWGLHPAFARYGDKISFADPGLFSDRDGVSAIASAWGALAAGLFCATRNRWPRAWPFPTVQWNAGTNRTAGVAGLPGKLSVARDFGAEVVAVDRSQCREARTVLKALEKDGSGKTAVFGVSSDSPAAAAERIALGSRWKTRRNRRILAALHVLPVLAAAAVAAIACIHWQHRRVAEQAAREVLASLTVHAGAYNAAVEAQSRLLDAARESAETGKSRHYVQEVPAFRRAMDNARDTMKKARLGEDAFLHVRESDFDSGTLKAFYDHMDVQAKQAELDLRVLLDPVAGTRNEGARDMALALVERQRKELDSRADFYALGVMELLIPSDPDACAEFRSFAKELRFLPRFAGEWLSDQASIDGELERLESAREREVADARARLDALREETAREEADFVSRLAGQGVPAARAEKIADSLAELSGKRAELTYLTNKVDQAKRDRHRENRASPADDDDLLWGKMLHFKSVNIPEAALEALSILERRGSDVYRPGAVRAAKAIVRAGGALPFTNGIMVLSFAPPATSHALFEPGDVVVEFDGRRVDWFPDYKSVPGAAYRFWRLGPDGTFAPHEGVMPPGQPLTAFENVNPEPPEK